MVRPLFARITGMLTVTLLALFFVSLLPLLSAARTVSYSSPDFTVNRELKGDRLPFRTAAGPSFWQSDFESLQTAKQSPVQSQTETPREIPFACEPSFSPVATPRLAYIYGRCMS
jgi:hypothetical protein